MWPWPWPLHWPQPLGPCGDSVLWRCCHRWSFYFELLLLGSILPETMWHRCLQVPKAGTATGESSDQEGQDVLLFIDNIFHFTQASSEVSALLGRIPSAVGYQPILATDMGTVHERITITKKGSITSV